MFIKRHSGRTEIRPPFVSNKRGWTFNPYPTHRYLWQEKKIYIYYLISFFLLNLNLNFSPSVSFGFGHLYINEASLKKKDEERQRKRGEERKKKQRKSTVCLLGALLAIPFPMHLVCVCAQEKRGERGR